MKPKRFSDNRELLCDLTLPKRDDPILAVCPKCSSKALVLPDIGKNVKCVCTKCSFNQIRSNKSLSFGWHIDRPHNGYFRLNLWLQTCCCGHSLYAFTVRHLNFLEDYIKADLRERRQNENGWRNASVGSRLPKWIKSHKNRKQLIKAIDKLKEKL